MSTSLFGGGPSLKFPNVGDEHEVTVVGEMYEEQQKDFDTDELLWWPDGNKRMQYVIPVEVDEPDPSIEDDDQLRRWYVKGESKKSLVKAMRKAKRREVEVGARIRIKYTKDGPKEGKKKPPKLWDVVYFPPEGESEHEVSQGVAKTREKVSAASGSGKKSEIDDSEPPY